MYLFYTYLNIKLFVKTLLNANLPNKIELFVSENTVYNMMNFNISFKLFYLNTCS